MGTTLSVLLAASFLIEVGALVVLIRAIMRDQFGGASGAKVIFHESEVGTPEDPAAVRPGEIRPDRPRRLPDREEREELEARRVADTSSKAPVLAFLGSSVFWLVLASIFGLLASTQLHWPDWLTGHAAGTFGRLRPAPLNVAAYGWLSMAEIGVALWLMPRLLRTPLVGGRWAIAGAVLWNLGMAAGLVAILAGWTDGMEWLEIPWQLDGLFVAAGALAGIPVLRTLAARKVPHLYVSVWYLTAAFLWFPFLFLVANAPIVHNGVEQAVVNWWYGHNALGLWFTPLALGSAYYLIPKVLGRPVHSYQLSLLGFWGLALFYSHVGVHHLIGGPVPTWLVTVSVVTSVMMFIPVIAVAVNHHFTMRGHFQALSHSPTLQFVVTGAVMYTLTSFEGSLESLRTVNRLTHFTHFTVAHAHMGAYWFASFVTFGAMYFLLPRLLERPWPRPALIRWHFRLATAGIALYVVALSIGGLLQGAAMLDPAKPFLESVRVTIPYLELRSLGGLLMTVSHLFFAWHVGLLLAGRRAAPVTTEVAVPENAEVA